jgi:hypothetical protein
MSGTNSCMRVYHPPTAQPSTTDAVFTNRSDRPTMDVNASEHPGKYFSLLVLIDQLISVRLDNFLDLVLLLVASTVLSRCMC